MKEETEKDLIFGTRPVLEALRAGKTLDKIFVKEGRHEGPLRELLAELKAQSIQAQFVPEMKLNRFTRKNHQGVVAIISPVPFHDIESIIPSLFERGENPLVVILDRVTDVRNFGAIVRSAECAGAHAVIVPARGGAAIHSDAVKTSAGALFRVPVCRSQNLKETIRFLKESGLSVIGCTEKADDLIFRTTLNGPTALIFGSEENGISPEYLKLCDQRGKIPMQGETASLNVSAAAAIVLFEVVRQRFEAI